MHVFYMILLSKLFPQKTENKWERGHIYRTISKDLCIIVFCGSLMPTYLWALSATSFQRSDEHCLNLAAATNRNWRKSFTRSKGIAPIDENLSSFLQKKLDHLIKNAKWSLAGCIVVQNDKLVKMTILQTM